MVELVLEHGAQVDMRVGQGCNYDNQVYGVYMSTLQHPLLSGDGDLHQSWRSHGAICLAHHGHFRRSSKWRSARPCT